MLSRAVATLLPLVPKPVVARVAARYVAGPDRAAALDTVASLAARGCLATTALLGEELREESEIAEVVREYVGLLEDLADRDLPSGVSVKPTHVGLSLGFEECHRNLEQIVAAAAERSRFVRIDMEDHTTTDATLALYGRLRERYHNVGLVLQAYLRRTLDDIDALPEAASVRICKGIYVEPREIAFHDFERIRGNFLAAVERLVQRGALVAIATHDTYLLERSRDLLDGTDARHEFQMLLGVTPVERQRLVDEGRRMRVYVPYGPDWYDYSLRRLRESPRIAGHVLRALVTGAKA